MFDSLNVTKAYKLTDNILGNEIEVVTFNAMLVKDSNINIFMNINYPNLYKTNKDEILIAYREFNAEITALACTMGLATQIDTPNLLSDLKPIQEEFKEMATKIFSNVITSLGDIQVNPVPIMEVSRY